MNLSAYSVGDVLPTRHGGRLKVTGYGPEFLLCDDGGAWVVVTGDDKQSYLTPYTGDTTGYVNSYHSRTGQHANGNGRPVKTMTRDNLPPDMTNVQTLTQGDGRQPAADSVADGDAPQATDPAAVTPLPVIITSNSLIRETSDASYSVLLAANGDAPQIFQYGGVLARVTAGGGRASIQLLDPPMLRHRLERVANYMSVRTTDTGQYVRAASAPEKVIADILAYPEYPGLPDLRGVVTAPIVAPGGQVRIEPGYDAATRLFYYVGGPLEVGDTDPTPDRIAWAVRLILDDLLGDFPFKDGASRANAVALVILPFARPLIDAPTPLHIATAPTPGTGKTLLARVTAMPFNPDGPAVMTAGQDEDEWRKRITALLSGGTSHLLIDNVKTALVSGTLAAVLSTPHWTDRILGKNQTITLPNRAIWMVTGNNLAVDTEMARRSVWIHLDSNAERPWTRNGFKHAPLQEWALEHRGDLVTAALILIRHWFNIGCPPGRQTIGGFEAYARIMGGILAAAGIDGFMGNAAELYEQSDPEAALWAAFVGEWWNQFQDKPVGVRELFPLADSEPSDDATGLGLLDTMLTGHNSRARRNRLGRILAEKKDTVVDGFKIQDAGTRKRASTYRLLHLGSVKGESGESR